MASDPSAAQAADLACWAEEGHAFASLLRYLSTVERRSSAECHRVIALARPLYDSRPENDDEAWAAVWAADNVGGAERGTAGDDFISTAGGAGGAPPEQSEAAGSASTSTSSTEPSCVKRLAPLGSSAPPSRKVPKHETVASRVQTKAPLAKGQETRMSNDCLAVRHDHPNDKRITFDEPSHTYYLDLIKLPTSVL